jgi:ADP-ribose pyrophosphatase YjhB (NUDIX family)
MSAPFYRLIHAVRKIYWFMVRPETHGVKCVIECGGKILMLRRTLGNAKWVFPGGAIKTDENMESAVTREVMEDVGLRLKDINLLGSFTQTILHRRETLHCFSAKVLSQSQVKIDEGRIKEAKWFLADCLPQPLTEVSQKVFDLYLAKL